MDIKKVEAVWLAAAVNTYEVCKAKMDWELDDIYFKQSEIVSDAKNIVNDEVPATMASQQCCAYTSYSVYRYLVAQDTLRRISYNGEFQGDKERPVFDKDMIISTSHGEIKCEELYRFIDEQFSPAILQKINKKYEKFDLEIIFQYLDDYTGEKYVSVEKAGERAEDMIEHSERGKAARIMLVNISNEIKSFMPKYGKLDVSNWINQGQNVDHYLWSELRKGGKDKFPTSMSIFVERNAGEFQLRVSVEARDSRCKDPEDYARHNRLLNIVNNNSELKYFVGGSLPNDLVISSLNNEELKKEVDNKKYKKVQICKFIPRDEVTKRSGKEIIEFIARAMEDLEPFYDLAVGGDLGKKPTSVGGGIPVENEVIFGDEVKLDNNMILYGPPGTGKTYYSVLYALAICDGKESLKGITYAAALERFNILKDEGQISFTTFHQSYGYEEFIEGIKPVISENDDMDDGDIRYEYSDGIFKKFCKAAGEVKVKAESIEINENPTVWNILLDGTGESELKKECFENDYIKIGWKEYDDVVTEDSPNLTVPAKRILLNFQDEMEIGDIILTQKSNNSIDGIGVITSPYKFDKGVDFPRIRDVRWIATGIDENVLLMNKNTRLDRNTVYPLRKMDISDVMKLIEKYTANDDISIDKNDKPYVFIIDEINRGNISKIFGELITLIEDTKRVGADEEMKVTLPYTGDEFGVPSNIYLLGTMNTADRSIALIDTALRRRFKFIEMMPNSSILRKLGADTIKSNDENRELDVASMLDTINQRIECLFDREHTIGHAFFTGLKENPTIEVLAEIFSKSVIPLLQEYFYEDYSKIQLVLGDNAKSDDKFKFILDSPIGARDVFKGSPDLDLPEKKYTIQREALYEIDSYLQINKNK